MKFALVFFDGFFQQTYKFQAENRQEALKFAMAHLDRNNPMAKKAGEWSLDKIDD